MDPYLVPEDVSQALAALGFVAVAPAGPEGGGWLATAVDDPARYVELHVLPAVLDEELARRLDVLRAVRHPHLTQLLDASEIAPGRVALLVEHVPGLTVAELRAARVALTDGEGVTLTVPVLQALTALHDAGLVHGPVTASSVVVRPDGRPVLVDLRGAVLGTGSVDGDVRRWMSTVIAQLPVADLDRLVVPDGGRTLRQLLEDGLRADVDVTALVAACFEVADPEALHLPDAGTLAGADLVRAAGRRAQPVPPVSRAARGARTWAVAAAAALALGVGGWGVSHRTAGAVERPDPVAAAVTLSRARAEVIGSGTVAALGDVEVPGGPAHRADVDLLTSLDGRVVEGLNIAVRSASPAGDPGEADVARVEVRSAVTSHVVVAPDGTRARVPASPESVVVLELRWTEEGWRVWEVGPA